MLDCVDLAREVLHGHWMFIHRQSYYLISLRALSTRSPFQLSIILKTFSDDKLMDRNAGIWKKDYARDLMWAWWSRPALCHSKSRDPHAISVDTVSCG
jgi:hypothetical protein